MTTESSSASADKAPSFMVRGQYIKDLSFENPNSPQSLTIQDQKPNLDINVEVRGLQLQENLYETTIQIGARASVKEGVLFHVELMYAGIFELSNIPADRVQPIVMVDGPFVLFPFARRVIADVTRDGGFPPLMLDPIDFHALFLRNTQTQSQKAG